MACFTTQFTIAIDTPRYNPRYNLYPRPSDIKAKTWPGNKASILYGITAINENTKVKPPLMPNKFLQEKGERIFARVRYT